MHRCPSATLRAPMIDERLIALLTEALTAAARELGLSGDLPEVELSKPRQKEHGDFATNVALVLAPRVERRPRDVAELIRKHLPEAPFVRSAEIAGPGFINFRLTTDWLTDALRRRGRPWRAAYGRAEPSGRRAQVEFVSANPTGPLHIGHARNAVLGDALARVLEAAGWSVEREYYFNDTGGQMDRFGASVEARYLQLAGARGRGPRGRLPRRRTSTELARGHRGTRSSRRWPICRAEERLARLRAGGRAARARADRRDARAVRGALRHLHLRAPCSRRRGRSTRPSNDSARRATSTRPRERCGSGRPRSATTRTASLIRAIGAHTYFAADCAYLIDKFAPRLRPPDLRLGRRSPRRRRAGHAAPPWRSGSTPSASRS